MPKSFVALFLAIQIALALSPNYATPEILTCGGVSLMNSHHSASRSIPNTYHIAYPISSQNHQIVFGASGLELPSEIHAPLSTSWSWQVKLINVSSGIGFKILTNQNQNNWRIQVSYLIWDKSYNQIFPIFETIKLTQKSSIRQVGSDYLLTFKNEKGQIEEEEQKQGSLVALTFLRGFSTNNGQDGVKIHFKGAFARQNGRIELINELEHIAYCYITILVIDRRALNKQNIILQYGLNKYSNNHPDNTLQLIQQFKLQQNSQLSSTEQILYQTTQFTFSQLTCPTSTRLNFTTHECIEDSQIGESGLVEFWQYERLSGRLLESESCSRSSGQDIVPCPNTNDYTYVTQCKQNEYCQIFASKCQAGYYTTTYLATTCTKCPTTLKFCNDCARGFASSTPMCLSCSAGRIPVNGVCVSCPTGCSSCMAVSEGYSCLGCSGNLLLQKSGANMICGCLSTQYLATTPSVSCISCPTNCLTCTSTACTKCSEGFYLQGSSCLPCMPVCRSCSNSLTCATCLDTTFTMVSNICTCTLPLLFNSINKKCQSCAVMQSNCLSCDYSSAYLPSNPPSVICSLASPSYYITAAGSTSQCSSYCSNCDPDNSVCNACNANFTFTTSCLCTTPTHFFNSTTNNCQFCNHVINGCATCDTQPIPTATTCILCDNGYMSPSGSYPISYCQKCNYLCSACDFVTGCTLCINPDLSLLTVGLTTVCGCIGVQFLHPTTLFCEICSDIINNCQSCLSAGSLITCATCNDNYYPTTSGLTCLPCSPSCKTCTSQTFCLLCETGYTLNGGLCQCGLLCADCIAYADPMFVGHCIQCDIATLVCSNCQPGYYLSASSCTSCSTVIANCFQCSSSPACLTCSFPLIYFQNSNRCDCDNTNGQYITNSIPNTCLSCQNVITNCMSCQNTIGSTKCLVCTDGYYLSLPLRQACLPCSLPCKNCDLSSTNCTSCATTFVITTPNTCACQQTNQYFYNAATLGCSACSSLIINCIDCYNNPTNHTLCQQCVSSYYFDTTSLKCQLCAVECSSCSSAGVCTGCNFDFVLSESLGLGLTPGSCICNNYTIPAYYYDSVTGRCLKCEQLITSCISCSYGTSVVCLTCKDATYLSGNQCLNCPSTCATCNATSCLTCPLDSTLDDGKCLCKSTCLECWSNSLNCLQCSLVGGVLTACTSCASGYYPLGENCLICPPTCASCTSASSCTVCLPTFVIDSTGICGCGTSVGLFPSNGVCQLCGEIIYSCKACDIDSSSSTICLSCIDGYFVSGNLCHPCHSNCLTCSTLEATCTSCAKGYELVLNNTCVCSSACSSCSLQIPNCASCIYNILNVVQSCEVCKAQYYLSGLNCAMCPNSCISCTTGGVCTSCLLNFQVIGGTCQCNNLKNMWATAGTCQLCRNIHPNCQTCITNASQLTNTTCTACLYKFYDLNGSCVASVCSDGKVTSGESCDDSNLIDGDGCSSFCLVQQSFLCSGQPSVCLINLNFKITVDSVIVDPMVCNRFRVNFQMDPVHEVYKNANFKDMLSFISNSNVTFMSWSYDSSSGIVSYTCDYFANLNKRTVDFYFEPAKLNIIQTKKIPIIIVEAYLSSSNNLGIIYYSEEVCSKKQSLQTAATVIQYASYATMVLTALPCKIVGLEWFGVLQLAHLSVGNMDKVNTLLTPIMGMKGVHGMSVQLDDSEKASGHRRLQSSNILTPDRVKSIGYSSNFLRNCNLMFFIVISIMAVSFILFLCSYLCKNCAPLLYSISRRVFKEVVLTLILFNCYNFAYSVGLHFYYASPDDPLYVYGTLCAVLAILLPFMICLVLSFSSQDGFGQYKDKLKPGVVERSYFIVTIVYRTGMGAYVATMNEQETSSLLVLAISILFLLYNLINLPFTKAYHNYRANICHITQFVCLFVTLYYRSMMSNKSYTNVAVNFTPVYIEYSCILLSFVVTILVLIIEIYVFVSQCCKPKKKEIQSNPLQVTQNEQLKDGEKYQKNNSHVSIHQKLSEVNAEVYFAE